MIRHTFNHFHVDQQLAEFLDWQGFWIHSVHATLESFLNILIFNMACYCYDFGLEVSCYAFILV